MSQSRRERERERERERRGETIREGEIERDRERKKYGERGRGHKKTNRQREGGEQITEVSNEEIYTECWPSTETLIL